MSWRTVAGGPCWMHGGHPLVTVEADQVRVEARLAARQIDCPGCPGSLRPWGWARPRGVRGLAGLLRPRRARCSGCGVTQVLLPVTVLAWRAYSVEVIGAALTARAGGAGSQADRGAVGCSGGDGAGLAAGGEWPVGGDPAVFVAGGPPGRC